MCALKSETPLYYNKSTFKVSTHIVSAVRGIIFIKSFLHLVLFHFCKAHVHATEWQFISTSIIQNSRLHLVQWLQTRLQGVDNWRYEQNIFQLFTETLMMPTANADLYYQKIKKVVAVEVLISLMNASNNSDLSDFNAV